MADTPPELDRVNSILIPNDVLATGPHTPWSIAVTRLLDLDDGEPELPAENSGRNGATITQNITQ